MTFMFRLTREVRLAVGARHDPAALINGHAGYPPTDDVGQFVTVQVSIAGTPDPQSGYVMNIQRIDQVVRRDGLDVLERRLPPPEAASALFARFHEVWPNIDQVRLSLSPYTCFSVHATEHPMVRFSHRFEFSAAHRLHNPALDAAANAALFGKCNNPNGHGHNYELEVTVRGQFPIIRLEEIVSETVIRRLDHKFLNLDVPEFAELNPTVENIAQTVFRLLKPKLDGLAAVTVWETPKTWCEYSE
jgi:6-pyruvoyltetrahydropterin/6-carboxytetrahydropterin synthase